MKKFISMLTALAIILVSACAFAQGHNRAPIVVLKFDDMSSNNYAKIEAFEEIVLLLLEEEVVGSFGIIGSWSQSEGNSDLFWSNVKKYLRCGMEIWSHGWNHDASGEGDHEFNHMFSDEEIKERFGKVLRLVENNTGGYKITTFGAPYNRTDDACAVMVNENYPQITAVFRSMEDDNTVNKTFNAVVIDPLYGIDGGFDELMNSYVSGSEVVALQGHPANMTEESRNEVQKIIRYFKEQGSVFMTPSQYASYVKMLEEYRKDDENKIALLCNNKILMSDSAPYIEKGRTMVPARIISENLNAKVSWNEETKTVTAERYGDIVEIKIDSDTALVNGNKTLLDAPARINNGRTMVPIRFIAEAFGAEVSWDNERRMVVIAN